MTIDRRTGHLIAVGAAVTANCHNCLQINAERAMNAGAETQDIGDAIEIGRKVRAGSASQFDAFVATVNLPPATSSVQQATCGC